MADKKRTRAVNFSNYEESVLVELVRKYQKIIECKKSDSKTWREKEACWAKLVEEFNSKSGACPRTVENLKSKFDNLKKQTKKKQCEEKKERFKTGGGVPVIPLVDSRTEIMREIMGVGLDGLHNPYDSNGFNNNTQVTSDPDDPEVVDEDIDEDQATVTHCLMPAPEVVIEHVDSFDMDADWSHWSPAMLKRPVSQELQVSSKPADHDQQSTPVPKRPRTKLTTGSCSASKTATSATSTAASKIISVTEKKLELLILQKNIMLKEEKERRQREKELHRINLKAARYDLLLKKARLTRYLSRR